MIKVNPTNVGVVSALQLTSTRMGQSNARPRLAKNDAPKLVNSSTLSPRVSDALARIAELVTSRTAAAPRENSTLAESRSEMLKFSNLTAIEAEHLRGFGANGFVRRTAANIDQTSFEKMVLKHALRDGMDKDEGFVQAMKNGTLKIQKASEVPELGYKTYLFDLYQDGNQVGGKSFTTMNREYYLNVQSTGIKQRTGSSAGLDFYMTWP